jgi:hypothetical protein
MFSCKETKLPSYVVCNTCEPDVESIKFFESGKFIYQIQYDVLGKYEFTGYWKRKGKIIKLFQDDNAFTTTKYGIDSIKIESENSILKLNYPFIDSLNNIEVVVNDAYFYNYNKGSIKIDKKINKIHLKGWFLDTTIVHNFSKSHIFEIKLPANIKINYPTHRIPYNKFKIQGLYMYPFKNCKMNKSMKYLLCF